MTWRFRRRAAPVPAPRVAPFSATGELPDVARVALWVHWEPDGQVSGADLALLQHVRELGFAVVAVGNRDDGGSERFAASLARSADVVVQRPNVGYDFAAFRDGLLWLRSRLGSDSTLLMLNNSCYGPFGSLEPLLGRADPGRADVWTATSSQELQPHLQSFLTLVHPAALAHEGFWRHWQQMDPPVDKMDVVRTCEIPLAGALRALGLRAEAVVPYEALAARALADLGRLGTDARHPSYTRVASRLHGGVPLNPSHHLWRWLPDAGVPLVKKDLLRVNPPGLPDVPHWQEHLPSADVTPLVAADLAARR